MSAAMMIDIVGRKSKVMIDRDIVFSIQVNCEQIYAVAKEQ